MLFAIAEMHSLPEGNLGTFKMVKEYTSKVIFLADHFKDSKRSESRQPSFLKLPLFNVTYIMQDTY